MAKNFYWKKINKQANINMCWDGLWNQDKVTQLFGMFVVVLTPLIKANLLVAPILQVKNCFGEYADFFL